MKHKFSLDGYCYRLRPVKVEDAEFIIEVRLEDTERNRFIHTISRDVDKQKEWIENYYNKPGDYYFVVENRITGEPEGLISFYDQKDDRAEWGRWVIKKNSLAASESVYLLYRIAFEQVGLKELYCCTLAENSSVVSFHKSIGELTREIRSIEFDGQNVDVIEQYSDPTNFYNNIAPVLEKQAARVFKRTLKHELKGFEFHHIAVACNSIKNEMSFYTLLGYKKENEYFEDPEQGIAGQFMIGDNMPRIELLENLPDSHTLDKFLDTQNKMYHVAYYVDDIEKAVSVFKKNKAIVLSPLKQSVYFKKRICFLMMRNMQMIELLER